MRTMAIKQLLAVVFFLGARLGVADDHLAVDGANIPSATWNAMINHQGRQRMFTQRMAKAFLMIARGINVEASKADLKLIMGNFDGTHKKLIAGEAPYDKPPVQMVWEGLNVVTEVWGRFKNLLETNMDNITATDTAVFQELAGVNIECLKKCNAVVGMYVDSAKSFGAATAGLQVDTAGRQRMLTQKMSKESFFIGLDFAKEGNLKNLEGTMDLFSESHEGILQGVNFVGLQQTTKKCTLWQMRTVSSLWSAFQPLLQQILDAEEAPEAILQVIADTNINLLVQMNVGVGLYVSDDGSKCADIENTGIDVGGWVNLINGGGKQRMMGQKASRLFFQIAKGVNRASSEVTLTGTMTTGGESLRALIEGNEGSNMPAPPTQEIADKLITLWGAWKKFSTVLDSNMKSAVIPGSVITRVSRLSVASLTSMNEAVEMYVAQALISKPEVASIVINIAGRQRMYQAKMSKEALLVVLREKVDENKANIAVTAGNFIDVHWRLLYGQKDAEGNSLIDRTTNVCMLNQMNLVLERFTALRTLCETIAEDGANARMADLEELDVSNPVAFGTMNTAVSMYAKGTATCNLEPSSLEWDSLMAEMNHVRFYIERVAKDYFFTRQKMNTTEGTIYLPASMAHLSASLHKLTYGDNAHSIHTPPAQAVSNKLFAVTDVYRQLEEKLLLEEPTSDDVDMVGTLSHALAEHTQELVNLYIDDAWEKDKSVEGARLNATGTLSAAIERLQKQAVMMQMTGCAPCKEQSANIRQTIETFEVTYRLLVNGNEEVAEGAERRLEATNGTKTTVRATESNLLLNQLKAIKAQWDTLKPAVETIVENFEEDGKTPTASALKEIADKSDTVSAETESAVDDFATASRTTTSVPLDILTPLPLTGGWSAGRTMRTAASFAQQVINEQQMVNPGFAIIHHFFDDRCDSQEGMRVVLKESVNDYYIALGGMGCSAVCESAAFAAQSMNMPFLSYECNGERLSDQEQYPDFTRFGTVLTKGTDVVKALVETYKWPRVTIMSGNPEKYRDDVQMIQQGLIDKEIASEYYSSYDTTFEETNSVVGTWVAAKRRVIMLVGDESFYRRVVCASRINNANLGITWLYEGIVGKNWWTTDDADLLAEAPECTGAAITEAFEGAINIANLGKALPTDEEKALDCFDGYTSETFLAAVEQHLIDGYPEVGNPEYVVTRPHQELIAHAADGACAFAKTMAHLMTKDGGEYTAENLRQGSPEMYRSFVDYIKSDLVFQGVSGKVNFTGNDKPETIAVKQIQAGDFVTVGMVFPNGSMRMDLGGGLVNDSWKAAKADVEEEFPYVIFQVLTPILCVCCPAIAGCIRSS